ncbi:MAG: type II toxin-antitoxin system VapC family toxin [Nitrososphaerales archaeon]
MYYVDSNIFIYSALYDSLKIEKARSSVSLLKHMANGRIRACTSTLTWDEVVWVVQRVFDVETAGRQGRMLLELPNLTTISVDRSILSGAQDLVERYGLKPRACIHASSAQKAGAAGFISYDSDFDGVKEINRVPPDVAISNIS